MPVAATMPNITSPAPPSTNCRTASTSAAIFGSRPSTIMISPAATQTKPLRTPGAPNSTPESGHQTSLKGVAGHSPGYRWRRPRV